MSTPDEPKTKPEPPSWLQPRHPLDENLLARHRAKVLHPADAVPAADGRPAPRTVYKNEQLLIPNQLIQAPESRGFIEGVLQQVDLKLDPEEVETNAGDEGRSSYRLMVADGLLPRRPIDAWTALQALARAADTGEQKSREQRYIKGISLEHLFFSTTLVDQLRLQGAPGKEGHGGGGEWGPARLPAFVPLASLPARGKGPVVAVLDTGCWTKHPWLGNNIVTVERPPDLAWQDPEISSDVVEPLLGLTDDAAGHGTFICGLIRQIEPSAKIVVYPVMHGDGVVEESFLNTQLRLLKQRRDIDVVVMAFGGYASRATGIRALRNELAPLAAAGVIMVASAGNDASSARVYPAAFRSVLGVGALTRSGTVAIYSNEASWVDTWYPGSSLVSTLPPFVGSRAPSLARSPLTAGSRPREAFDPDRHSYRFGVWNGTSFAAAVAGARAAYWLNRTPPTATMSATDRSEKVKAELITEGKDESWPR